MSQVRVGDVVFRVSGEPSVITGQDQKSGVLQLDRSNEAVRTSVRHGFINGLKPEDRLQYNEILDDAKKLEAPTERVALLEERIGKLKEGDLKKNYELIRYLNSEVAHLKSTHNMKSRSYTLEEDRIRTA